MTLVFDTSIIFKKKKSSDDYLYCYVRVYNKENHKTKLVSTKLTFPEKDVHWGGKNLKEKNSNKFKRLRGFYIKDKVENFEKLNETIELNLDKIRNDLKTSQSPRLDSGDFIQYVESYTRRLKTLKKHGTSNGYLTFIKDLKNYSKTRNLKTIKFNDINKVFVNDFQYYLEEKKLKESTIQIRMYKFKKMVEKSIDEDVFITRKNPFFRYKYTIKPIKKDILTEKELDLIINTEPLRNSIRSHYIYLDDEGYETHHPIEISRLLFLFQFFSNGMRVSDVLFLRWKNFNVSEDFNEIQYDMYKTKINCRIGINDHIISVLKHFLNKEDVFTTYKEQVDECPKCYSKNIVKNGGFEHRIKRTGLKCSDCGRNFVKRKKLPFNSFFNHHLIHDSGDIEQEIYFDHFDIESHPEDLINSSVYQVDNIYYNDLVLQKESDKKKLEELEPKKVSEIETRLKELLVEGNTDVVWEGELPEDEFNKIEMKYSKLKKDIENNLNKINTSLSLFKETEEKHYLSIFKKYSEERPNDFVFPMLNSDDFRQLDDLNVLPEDLYLQYTTKSRRHGGLLKQVQKKLNIKTNLTSHTSRHTFTSILVKKNIDVYTISRSLGHSSISITEKYLPLYDFKRISDDLKDFNSDFSTDHL